MRYITLICLTSVEQVSITYISHLRHLIPDNQMIMAEEATTAIFMLNIAQGSLLLPVLYILGMTWLGSVLSGLYCSKKVSCGTEYFSTCLCHLSSLTSNFHSVERMVRFTY